MAQPRTAVFTGDSITDCGRRDDPARLGSGYVRDLAHHEAMQGYTVINTGVGGDRVADVLERVDEAVVRHEPELVSLLVGINDTWRRYDSDDPTSESEFSDRYEAVLQRIVSPGRRLVLVEPFLVAVTVAQWGWRADLDPKIEVVRRLAEQYGAALVPADGALRSAADEYGPERIAADGVHPTALGHRLLANAWIDTIVTADVAL
jgi:lysophospholipase L1-like esterase